MITLLIFSLVVTVAYLAFVIKKFGIPESISDSYYLLEKWKKGSGRLFTLWTLLAGFPLMIYWLSASEGIWYQFLAFFAPASLIFLGVAAEFKQELTKQVHYTSAGVCAVSAGLWCALSGYWHVVINFYVIFSAIATRYKKWVFWLEIAALVSTFILLMIY